MKKRNLLYIALFTVGAFAACKKNVEVIYQTTNDDRYPVIVANTTFTNPTLVTAGTTTVASGSTIAVELNYVQTDPIDKVQFLQKIATADSTVISSNPYAPAFSKNKQCDTLLYSYIVPAQASGTAIVVRARVVNKNGLFRDRSFAFKIK